MGISVTGKIQSQQAIASPAEALRVRSAVQAWIPGVTIPVIPTTKNTRFGRGMIVPITVAANTPLLVQHNLGRPVQQMMCTINDNLGPGLGSSYCPNIKKAVGQDDSQYVTIETDGACTNMLVWMM